MPQPTYEFGSFTLDPVEHRLLDDGQPIPLTPKAFELLRVLVEHAGHLVEKERLLKEVWPDTFVEEANLNRAISVLRKTLRETAETRYIETIPKRGYRFVAPVRQQSDGAPATSPVVPSVLPAARRRSFGVAAAGAVVLGLLVYAGFGRGGAPEGVVRSSFPIHRQLTFTGREVTPTLSPDGRRVAYVSRDLPHRKVVVQEVDGEQRTAVFSAPEAGALRWSPDSRELMFWARGEGTDGVYIVPASGGSARKVAKGWFVTCWSPDGSTIALALFTEQKIRLINRLGEEQRTIALQGSRQWIWDVDWSPVHDRLLFVATDENRRGAIWSIKSDGSGQTKILSSDGEIPAARWGPSGSDVYYFNRVNQTVSVFRSPAIPQAGRLSPKPLMSGLEGDGSYGLSADASRIVYARAPYHSNLWLVDVDPTSPKPVRTTQLTHGTSVVERPRVSPDGTSILFNMGYESRANLYAIPAGGGDARQLTSLNAFSVGGVWSPDGETVAFASTEGGALRLWAVGADGRSVRPLQAADISENFNFAWAPGPRLLYLKAGNKSFSVIDSATWLAREFLGEDARRFVCCPEYSPDGRKLVMYMSWPRRGLWVMESDGSNPVLIHHAAAPFDSNPTPIGWSADGRAIYAYDGRSAAARGLSVAFGETVTAARIVRIPVDGGPLTTVLELPFDEVGGIAMFPDGRRFVVSVYSSRSDVWMAEPFDPARTAHGGDGGHGTTSTRRRGATE